MKPHDGVVEEAFNLPRIPFMAIIVLLSTGFFAHDPDHWHTQIMFGEMAVCLWLANEIKNKVHLVPAIAFLYFSIYAVYCEFRLSLFVASPGDLQSVFDGATARSICFLILAVLPFIFASQKDLLKWWDAFKIFSVVDAAYMIFQYLKTGHATGLIGADSVDGSALAILFPMLIFGNNGREAGVVFAALALSKSSTVFGILCLQILTYVLFFVKSNWKKWVALVVGALATVPLGILYLGQRELFNVNGRHAILFNTWDAFITTFPGSINKWLFGLGQGAFLVTMPFRQNLTQHYWVWLHNEPVQVLFEQGAIGLSLLVAVYFTALWKVKNSKPLFLMVTAAGFQSFIQPCFRYFLFALVMAFICRISFFNYKEKLL